VKRKGNVVARVVENIRTETLEAFVRETVSNRVSLICTDDFSGYRRLSRQYNHGIINRSEGKYVKWGVVGAIHTNTIEGFWSIIKRGVVGTFHKVSRKYLPLYVAEFQFRYNNRENADIFGTAISGC
jgi:transposase-like protein